eukprot:1510306-Alexandrium_andersonii.AAC.2
MNLIEGGAAAMPRHPEFARAGWGIGCGLDRWMGQAGTRSLGFGGGGDVWRARLDTDAMERDVVQWVRGGRAR